MHVSGWRTLFPQAIVLFFEFEESFYCIGSSSVKQLPSPSDHFDSINLFPGHPLPYRNPVHFCPQNDSLAAHITIYIQTAKYSCPFTTPSTMDAAINLEVRSSGHLKSGQNALEMVAANGWFRASPVPSISLLQGKTDPSLHGLQEWSHPMPNSSQKDPRRCYRACRRNVARL